MCVCDECVCVCVCVCVCDECVCVCVCVCVYHALTCVAVLWTMFRLHDNTSSIECSSFLNLSVAPR